MRTHRRWLVVFLASLLLVPIVAGRHAAAPRPAAAPVPQAAADLIAQRPPQPVPQLPAPTDRPVPFAAGETLTYDISWSSVLTAGTATIAVRSRKPSYGSVAYYITAEGQAVSLVAALYPLYYKADTLLDVYSLLPQRASIYSRERGRQRMKETMFDHARRTARFTTGILDAGGPAPAARTFRIPAAAQDPLSVLFWLRTVELKEGKKVPVAVTFNGTVYQVELVVRRREALPNRAGARQAWRISPLVVGGPRSTARNMTLWVSDDERRLPLRMEVELAVGRFELTLTDARGVTP